MTGLKHVRQAEFQPAHDRGWQEQLFGHVHRQGAEYLAVALSEEIRRPVRVQYVDYRGGGYVRPPGKQVAASITLGPRANVWVDLDGPAANCLVDLMVGGTGERGNEPLTELEGALLRRVLQCLPSVLARWWHEQVELHPTVNELVIANSPSPRGKSGDDGVVVSFLLFLGRTRGLLRVYYDRACRDWLTREALGGRVAPRVGGPQEDRDELVSGTIGRVHVDVSAQLGVSELTVRQVLELRSGDLLMTKTGASEALRVMVGERAKFSALVGRRGNRIALEIVEVLEGVSEGA